MLQETKKDDKNVAVEAMFVGSFYKNPDLYIEVGKLVVSKYDLSDDASRFFYDCFASMYETFSQRFDEQNINAWMTQDKDRLKKYRLYGGYSIIKTWMGLAQDSDFKNYFAIVKKFSLVREYSRNGFPSERILDFPNFDNLSAKDIYRLIRSKADRIFTVIDGDEESVVVNEGMSNVVESLVFTPDLGLPYPFPLINEFFKGMSEQTFVCIGMLSNAGKTRLMIYLVAYLSLVLKQKTFVMLNEMTEKSVRHCLITTVLNNKAFQKLHGVKLRKPEKEITLGLYRDKGGNFIRQHADETGRFIESQEDFLSRLVAESDEYNQVMKVAKWIETESQGRIFLKELMRYDDEVLEFEIRKAVLIHNIKYCFYDTLKSTNDAEWSILKMTTSKLKQLANELNIYLYGSIQLTDDSHHVEPLALNSSSIASSKHLKHLLDMLILCKSIPRATYHKYSIIQTDEAWGESCETELDLSDNYVCFVIDKNRKGDKAAVAMRVDLNMNTWDEVGLLSKSKKPKQD